MPSLANDSEQCDGLATKVHTDATNATVTSRAEGGRPQADGQTAAGCRRTDRRPARQTAGRANGSDGPGATGPKRAPLGAGEAAARDGRLGLVEPHRRASAGTLTDHGHELTVDLAAVS